MFDSRARHHMNKQKPKPGRPPLRVKRDQIIAVRMTKKEHRAVDDASRKAEQTISTFARGVLLEKVIKPALKD